MVAPVDGSKRDEMETAMRRLLEQGGLAQPDEIHPHEDGGIVCLWHEQKLAVIVDPDPPEDGAEDRLPGLKRLPYNRSSGAIAQLGERLPCK